MKFVIFSYSEHTMMTLTLQFYYLLHNPEFYC